jgi:hypothetical protein
MSECDARYIDQVYESILQWHREHDEPVHATKGRQRGTVAKRAPLSTTTASESTRPPITETTPTKSRPSSLTGSLREKASKLRRSSVSSLTALFDGGGGKQQQCTDK